MHTYSSRLYRKTRIPGHMLQIAATIRVLMYLSERYTELSATRHGIRAVEAMEHIEAGFWARPHACQEVTLTAHI